MSALRSFEKTHESEWRLSLVLETEPLLHMEQLLGGFLELVDLLLLQVLFDDVRDAITAEHARQRQVDVLGNPVKVLK